MSEPCVVALGHQVYRLDDGPLVLVGTQQHWVLQIVLEMQYSDAPSLLNLNQQMAFDNDRQLHDHLRRAGRLSAAVRLTTADFQFEFGDEGRNLSAILKSLKRGPLGPAIELPGHRRKGRGYLIRIQGLPDYLLQYKS